MNRDWRVRIDALGGNVPENRVQSAPHGGAFGKSIGFEGRDSALGNAFNHLAEFLLQLGRETTGFGRTQ